jgi:hypothetical protein
MSLERSQTESERENTQEPKLKDLKEELLLNSPICHQFYTSLLRRRQITRMGRKRGGGLMSPESDGEPKSSLFYVGSD